MHVHGIPKSSDRESTWIACIIYKIPQKKKTRVVRTSIYYITPLLCLICSAKAKIELK